MPHKLRIAVSVFFGLLTVALCVLWMRSLHKEESVWFSCPVIGFMHAGSTGGLVWFTHIPYSKGVDWGGESRDLSQSSHWGFGLRFPAIGVPFWFLVTLATLPLCWLLPSCRNSLPRFSLRTLLIATTLVAVVLGLGVWLSR